MPATKWEETLRDFGYNPSPVWSMVGGAIANAVPTSSRAVFALPWIDGALMVAALGLCVGAFGLQATLIAVLFLTSHLVTDHTHLKASYLRLDFLAALLVALSLLKTRRPASAGVFAGYSAAVRLFPLLFAFGPFCRVVWIRWKEKRWDREAIVFLSAMAATALVLSVVAGVVYGVDYWREFALRISAHAEKLSSWRVGFLYVFLVPAYILDMSRHKLLSELSVLYWGCKLVAVAVVFWSCRRLRTWEALGVGFVIFFFVASTTYYYYIALIIPTLFLASRVPSRLPVISLIWLFVSGIVGHVLFREFGLGRELFGTLSAMMLVLCGLLVAVAHGTNDDVREGVHSS